MASVTGRGKKEVRWILMVVALLTGDIAPAAASTSSGGDGPGEQKWGIADLPLAARFAISRVLEQEDERYAGLMAYDTTGRELPAWMEVGRGELRLRVEDRGAAYPLVVAPFVQSAKLTASDGAEDDYFGRSVAISGDTVVVGADRDDIGGNAYQGSAYVFVRPQGGWTDMTESAKLTASEGAAGDLFGQSVAIGGDTVVVGAQYDSTGGNANHGSAYVFVRPQEGWMDMSETIKLTASDRTGFDYFGSSVAIDGDTVVVGADHDEIGGNAYQGSAYVFVRPVGGWIGTLTESAKLTASDGAGYDFFGQSVAISGNTVVIGADHDEIGVNTWQGSVYVFEQPQGGWTDMTERAKLTASDGAEDDYFGRSVAISGDTVVVGAVFGDIGGNADQGSAYVFVRPQEGWMDMTQSAKLTASDGAWGDEFGQSVAIGGDTVVVGAYVDDIGEHVAQGSAYVFDRPQEGWLDMTQSAKLTASDGTGGDFFAVSVAIDGDTLVVGAYGGAIGGNDWQGSAYVFEPDTDGDGIADGSDNCPSTANPGQEDFDRDGIGDACDNDDDRADVDGNGVADALTDGLLIIRRLFGFGGSALTDGAVASDCTRCDPTAIATYIDQVHEGLDVDGNAQTDALTDGLLIIRYLFGFQGAALTDGAVGNGCTRCTAAEIEEYCAILQP
jgi:hypothetical protein